MPLSASSLFQQSHDLANKLKHSKNRETAFLCSKMQPIVAELCNDIYREKDGSLINMMSKQITLRAFSLEIALKVKYSL